MIKSFLEFEQMASTQTEHYGLLNPTITQIELSSRLSGDLKLGMLCYWFYYL